MLDLLDLPTNVIELVFEATSKECGPLEANTRIIKLLRACLHEHERNAASGSITPGCYDSDSEDDDPQSSAQQRANSAVNACRTVIELLPSLPVPIESSAHLAALASQHSDLFMCALDSIPIREHESASGSDFRQRIDVRLRAPVVPRVAAWSLAGTCRTLLGIGVSLPLLQPLALKLAREAAVENSAPWFVRDEEEGEESDEQGEWIPPRRLSALRLLAAHEVASRLAGRRLLRHESSLRAFLDIPDLAERAAGNEYRAAGGHDSFRGGADLCFGLRLGYGTAVRLLAAGRRWRGNGYDSLPMSAPAPEGEYIELPSIAAVDAAVQHYSDVLMQRCSTSTNSLDMSYATLQNRGDLKTRAGQAAGLTESEMAHRVDGVVEILFTGYQDEAGPEVVIGIKLCDLERFGFDLAPEFGVEWGAGLDGRGRIGEIDETNIDVDHRRANIDVVGVSRRFVAGVLGWSTESALFASVEREISGRMTQLLDSVDAAARAELLATRRAAVSRADAWHRATTMAAQPGWHVVFNEGC